MISLALQKGSSVVVYNEKNNTIFSRTGTLVGYTSNTVSIRTGTSNSITTYDEKGNTISIHH